MKVSAGRMSEHAAHRMPEGGEHDVALKISAWLTGIYFIIELGIGLYTGSVAVTSDAFHTFSAVGGVVLAFAAGRLARRPARLARTFGNYRAEIIGALCLSRRNGDPGVGHGGDATFASDRTAYDPHAARRR
jgi:Co/Zn/Cd efflux system component